MASPSFRLCQSDVRCSLQQKYPAALNLVSYKLISLYMQKNIDVKIIKNNANIQLGLSLRKGVKNCKSPLIIRADSDDINSKSRFKTLINYYKKK